MVLFPHLWFLDISHKLAFSLLALHRPSSLFASPFTNDYLKFLHILSSIFIYILGPESLLLSLTYLSSTVIVFKIMTPKRYMLLFWLAAEQTVCHWKGRLAFWEQEGGQTECSPPHGRQQNGRLDRLFIQIIQMITWQLINCSERDKKARDRYSCCLTFLKYWNPWSCLLKGNAVTRLDLGEGSLRMVETFSTWD